MPVPYPSIIPSVCRLTGKEKRVGGFDLLWDDGPVMADEGGIECVPSPQTFSTNSFLGESLVEYS